MSTVSNQSISINKINVVDVVRGARRFAFQRISPCWSPNGPAIAYWTSPHIQVERIDWMFSLQPSFPQRLGYRNYNATNDRGCSCPQPAAMVMSVVIVVDIDGVW